MRIELAGGLRLVTDDGTVVEADAFPGRQGRAVFARLAAHHGPVPREELADLLWPARWPGSWERDLSVVVSRLRTLLRSAGLGSGLLVGSAGTYELRLPVGAIVDVDLVPDDLARAQAAFDAGDMEAAAAAAAAAAASARRPLLPGLDAAWLDIRRDELQSLLVDALDLAARARSLLGDAAEAVRYAREAVALQPLRERGHATLMRVHLAAGDRARAVQAYEECRAVLADELGVDPAAETQRVYLEALRADATTEHAAGRVQVASSLPAGAPVAPGNLPAAVDTLWGRDTDLFALGQLVRRRRVVTLAGVGGVGKSRLAVECARRLASGYRDGAWLCELSTLRPRDPVGHAIATALDVVLSPGGETIDALTDALRSRCLLVVLDNCEHLLAAVRPLVAALSERCPSTHVLATSREPLGLPGEHVWRVQPLALPVPGSPPTSLSHRTPALQLFADRARAVDATFTLTDTTVPAVADICRRVDGLPLAIELAARRVAVLSPVEIADRLRTRCGCSSAAGPSTSNASTISDGRSRGPTTCSRTASSVRSSAWPSVPATWTSRPPPACAACPRTAPSTSSTASWTSPWSSPIPARRAATGCTRPCASTRASGWRPVDGPRRRVRSTPATSSRSPRRRNHGSVRQRRHRRCSSWIVSWPTCGAPTAGRGTMTSNRPCGCQRPCTGTRSSGTGSSSTAGRTRR